MAPGTGGRGAPPPKDGVYRPSPSVKQAHFPSRRTMVRAYGTPRRRQETVALKQQTLTQIDFVSSFGEDHDPIVLSDSDEGGLDEGKETSKETEQTVELNHDGPRHRDHDDAGGAKDASPRTAKRRIKPNTEVRRKRLATVEGDEQSAKRKPGFARQKSISSSATPSHHTQTLTQFLGRDSHVAATLDEEDDLAFLEWLGEPSSPKIVDKNARRSMESKSCQTTKDPTSDREGSVVPQTPVKSRNRSTGGTSPGDVSTASTMRSIRHVGFDQQQSSMTLKEPTDKLVGQGEKTASLVIQDSFVTSSWNSETPTRRSQRQLGLNESQNASLSVLNTSPLKAKSIARSPTPDRHADTMLNRGLKGKQKVGFDDEHLVSFVGQRSSGNGASMNPQEIPDSEDDDDGLSGSGIYDSQDDDEAAYVAGAETQLVLEELSFIARQQELEGESNADSKTPTLSSPTLSSDAKLTRPIHKVKSPTQDKHVQSPLVPNQASRKGNPRDRPLRRPLPPPPVYDQSQFAESQRVPIQILQGLPPASARSDIVLPMESESLSSLIDGYQVELCISHKIPNQVVRFWLFDGSHLRYMACVQHGRPRGSQWTYAVDQVYELNNPVADGDMREEGWVNGQIRRYVYLPPAVVGQLLWNLKHAIFADDSVDECDHTANHSPSGLETNNIRDNHVSTAPTRVAQPVSLLRTRDNEDLISTQGSETNTTQSISNITPRPITTTKTQPLSSSPTKTNSRLPRDQPAASLAKPHHPPSSQLYTDDPDQSPPLPSSSLVFQDHGASAVSPLARDVHLSVSQLLTKSQMLPDSLLQDGPRLPQEIWDSDDDVDF